MAILKSAILFTGKMKGIRSYYDRDAKKTSTRKTVITVKDRGNLLLLGVSNTSLG